MWCERRMTTVPVPCVAAIAAYPWLGCTGDTTIRVQNSWGVFPDVFCPREATFTFLENVLTEVLALFPSPYIHIGGDEVPKDRWRACADCQELMRREGLGDENELQSWFVRRMERWLSAHGRRLIGWDEITEGGLAPNAVVQVWREAATIATVARQGHDLIASPSGSVYINRTPGELPLAQVYAFEPVPPGLSAQESARILGGEALLLQALPMLERGLPAGHVETGRLWTNLGEVRRAQRRWKEAALAYQKGLEILRSAWGPEDQRLLKWLERYAAVLRSSEEYAEAARQDMQAMRIRVANALR